MKLAITGATGYIGNRLVAHACQAGHAILAMTRVQPGRTELSWQHYDLTDTTPPILPRDVDVLIHLAANTSTSAPDIRVETQAAQILLDASKRVGARFIFVSSQTASANAPTAYGQGKWLVEQMVLAAGGWVIRPGLVYGGPTCALYGTLVETVARLPVLPAFWPAPQIQPIHVDDLCTAILAGSKARTGLSCLGSNTTISFNDFLGLIARERVRCWRPRLPVPALAFRLLYWLLSERLRNRLGLARLLSLFELPRMETTADLAQIGLALRPLGIGLTSRRRALLCEANTLLIYVLRDRPTSALRRRYVRCVEQLRDGQPLVLPRLCLRHSTLLALFDSPALMTNAFGRELAWRLDTAVALAEASPMGSRRFLLLERRNGKSLALLRIVRAFAEELGWRALALILKPWLIPKFGKSGITE